MLGLAPLQEIKAPIIDFTWYIKYKHFYNSSRNRRTVAGPWGQGIVRFLWAHGLTYVPNMTALFCIRHNAILDRDI